MLVSIQYDAREKREVATGPVHARVLVLDDDVELLDLIGLILEERGYTVARACNGREGLKRFEAERPDLIITDVMMPDMEGIEFIRTLRKKGGSIPLIVMSGDVTGTKFLDSARLLGARAVLRKPFSADELQRAMSAALEKPAG